MTSTPPHPVFEAKNMPFRRIGSTGLRVPVMSYGTHHTFGESITGDSAKAMIKTAFDLGCNMFDVAENQAEGRAEIELGRAIKELNFRRCDITISTKIFFGVMDDGKSPNDGGLSRKHIVEGLKSSLERLGLDYVDIVYAHRPDENVAIEETVRAFNWVIEKGWAFYWGTSEWSAGDIEEAHSVAARLGLMPPVIEQCRHQILWRERAEHEYAPLYKKYGMGRAAFLPLAGGLLTGKYGEGAPPGSRFFNRADLNTPVRQAQIAKTKELAVLAEADLGCTVGQLALAWLAHDPNTSTMVVGASRPEQLLENVKAFEVIPKLTPEILQKIEDIIQNKPQTMPGYRRPPLDPYGRR